MQKIFYIVCFVALFIGCEKAQAPLADATSKVAISIGDEAISLADFSAHMKFEYAFKKYLSKKKEFVSFGEFASKYKIQVTANVINSTLLRQEARRLGVQISKADLSQGHERMLESAKFNGDYNGFLRTMGVRRDLLDERISTDLIKEKVLRKLYPDLNGFSDKEVAEVKKRFVDYNRRVAATNACLMVLSTNLIEKLRSGEDFVTLGKANSQMFPEFVDEWGTFEYSELQEAGIRDWAFSAPLESVGGPFVIEEGFVIVKLLSRTEGVKVDTPLAKDRATVKLARITLPRFADAKLPDDEGLRVEMYKQRSMESEIELFKRLHGEIPVSFPLGTNFYNQCAYNIKIEVSPK